MKGHKRKNKEYLCSHILHVIRRLVGHKRTSSASVDIANFRAMSDSGMQNAIIDLATKL